MPAKHINTIGPRFGTPAFSRRARKPRRLAIYGALIFALGSLINYFVAAALPGMARRLPQSGDFSIVTNRQSIARLLRTPPASIEDGDGLYYNVALVHASFGCNYITLGRMADPGAAEVVYLVEAVVVESGWPLKSLVGQVDYGYGGSVLLRKTHSAWLCQTASSAGGDLVIPLSPKWGEFVVNSALYAVIIITTPIGIRRLVLQRRIRRGKCVRCNYTLMQLETCPECGHSSRQD